MKTTEFKNKPTKTISLNNFKLLFNTIGLNFFGLEHISITDRDLFEEKLNCCFDIKSNNVIILHNLNYKWED